MKGLLFRIVFNLQKAILFLSYKVCSLVVKRDKLTWVVGVEEIASVLSGLSKVFARSVTVNLFKHEFYNDQYDYSLPRRSNSLYCIVGPILFGYVVAKYSRFCYVGSKGYLLPLVDGREYEFSFLKSRGKSLINYYTGSEIRSFRKLEQYGRENGLDTIVSYQRFVRPDLASDASERFKQQLSEVSDRFADLIFNPPIDQMSYFERETQGCLYFVEPGDIQRNDRKFEDLSTIKIVHAPTSPVIKGTPLVRAALKRLRSEGYRFTYLELSGMKNSEILRALSECHIVLNQFYAFIPSILGVEALSKHTALLTSADESIETTLFPGSNEAWMVTSYSDVYFNLKSLLDNPKNIKLQADAGLEYCLRECSVGAARLRMENIMREVGLY